MNHIIPSLIVLAAATVMGIPITADEGTEFFEKRIRPVLVKHCYDCHSVDADSLKGGLFLDSREGIRKGCDSGSAVVPGDLNKSLILAALRYETYEMPPSGKLPEEVIADFVKWIELGAPDPREVTKVIQPVQAAEIDWQEARQHWAFQIPVSAPRPDVKNVAWAQRDLDYFILEKLELAGIRPNPRADRATLLRRITFDLTGLPPSPEEVDRFLDDSSPEAIARVIDRLLASPAYGERWARLWLDVARYAEDQAHIVGDDRSLCYPNAYLYRDWVIHALNSDMPYDEFLIRQLANDQLEPVDDSQLAALGFMGLGPKYYRRNSPEVMAEEWEDRVDTLSRGLLGLTVACARCHHHKYDPVTTEDYYALAGVFASTEMFNRPLPGAELTDRGDVKNTDAAVHIVRDKNPHNLNVMIRGDVNNTGPEVPRRFVQILCAGDPAAFAQGSGRLELARAITARDNPLTARVFVNRIWAQLLGRPLVSTLSNFGSLGDPPSHPELLDDLAVRFMDQGWSIKWLMREIVCSATYQQSSAINVQQSLTDPENKLLGHMNRKKLDVETWRDALLAASGVLQHHVGGPSMNPADPQQTRRTLYAEISRLELNKMLALFDFPDPNTHSPGRVRTTTPLQKLFILNSPFIVQRAQDLLALLEADAGSNVRYRIDLAYRRLYGRFPTDEEITLAESYLDQHQTERERWVNYTHALLASNELLYLD